MWVDGSAQLLSLHLEPAYESLCPQYDTSGSNHQDYAGRRLGAPTDPPQVPHPPMSPAQALWVARVLLRNVWKLWSVGACVA